MAPCRSADILDESAELCAKGNENLIFVLDAFCGWQAMSAVGTGGGQAERHPSRREGAGRGRDGPSRKGISSTRVRSGPKARAMVERRWMALRRSWTSSCCKKVRVNQGQRGDVAVTASQGQDHTFNSSMSTAMG